LKYLIQTITTILLCATIAFAQKTLIHAGSM